MKNEVEYLHEETDHGKIPVTAAVALNALSHCLKDHYKVIEELAERHASLKKLFDELVDKINSIAQ